MILFENVDFGYSSQKKVLNDIRFHLVPGHIYGLLGKNGVGKSTLFRLITGANPPSNGIIRTHGVDPFQRLPQMMADLFLLPEEMTFPALSALEYAKLYGVFYPRFSLADLKNLLKRFELDENQKLKTMSQGQRKKAYMSFALACNTHLLLMDEPTNGLDIPGKTEFRKILSEYRSEDRLVIISTHQVRDLERLIDAVMILDEGSLVMCQTASDLLKTFHFGDVSQNEKKIYSEETVRGRVGIAVREENQDVQGIERLDLETLFNAVMHQQEEIYHYLGV